jgi:CDP-glucose 4,6-dehydratase
MESLVMKGSTFWRGRRVFMTGHTGFKGSWLCEWLLSMGAEIQGYSLAPVSKPNLFDMSVLEKRMGHALGDIRDLKNLTSSMKAFKPEVLMHLAAQPIVRDSYKDPIGTYQTNVIGTANVLEAARSCPELRSILVITTDKVYENREWVWGYRENEAFGGYDPYSSSKACAEIVTASYRNSFFNPAEYGRSHHVAIATVRAGNVIGGGDWASDRLVPDCLRAFGRGEKVRIRNPGSTRPWQHVLDPLSAYIKLAERLYYGIEYAEGWNVGPSDTDSKPVEWIVQRMCDLWGAGADYSVDEGSHPHEANFLKLDCSKIRARLGWEPRWDLATALEKTVAWEKARLSGESAAGLCARQIVEYIEEGEFP